MDKELSRDEKIDRVIELFEEMEAAFRLFVKFGNAFKWTLYIGTAILAFLGAMKGVNR